MKIDTKLLKLTSTPWTPWEPVIIKHPGREARPHPIASQQRHIDYYIGGVCIAKLREVQTSFGVCQYLLYIAADTTRFPEKYGSAELAAAALISKLEEV